MLSSLFASIERSSSESSSLTNIGSLSIEASSFSLTGVVSDASATSTSTSFEEDPKAGETGQVDELGGAGRPRITSSKFWFVRLISHLQ